MDSEMREIVETFAAECAEHIKKATDCILLIEENKDEEALNGLFRVFHTIKGNARMLEFNDIGELAHAAENVMAKLRNGTLNPTKQVVDLLLSALDSVGVMLAEKMDGTKEPMRVDALMAALNAVAAEAESPQNVKIGTLQGQIAKKAAPQVEAAEGDEKMPRVSRKLSILVVEDDFLSRKTILAMLRPFGVCDIASNGQEAVEAFAKSLLEDSPYDLVCMDIMMPRMDGFEAVRQLRSAEMIAAVRKLKQQGNTSAYYERKDAVILMTSSLDDPDNYINACYRSGANAYLVKPIQKETLHAALKRFGFLAAS